MANKPKSKQQPPTAAVVQAMARFVKYRTLIRRLHDAGARGILTDASTGIILADVRQRRGQNSDNRPFECWLNAFARWRGWTRTQLVWTAALGGKPAMWTYSAFIDTSLVCHGAAEVSNDAIIEAILSLEGGKA